MNANTTTQFAVSSTAATVHPFEAQGLGLAPFSCYFAYKSDYMTSCQVCGHGIINVFMIRSSDGKTFRTGCECVNKAGQVDGFESTRRAYIIGQRQSRVNAANEAKRLSKAEAKRMRIASAFNEFYKEQPLVCAFLNEYTGTNYFIQEMKRNLFEEWGHLSFNQIQCVLKEIDLFEKSKLVKDCFFSTVGKREKSVMVKVLSTCKVGQSYYGSTYLTRMVTDSGAQLVWFSGNIIPVSDEFQQVAFTVKDHQVYNGAKQTVVTRVTSKNTI